MKAARGPSRTKAGKEGEKLVRLMATNKQHNQSSDDATNEVLYATEPKHCSTRQNR
jgi:hypothetical protein